MHIGIGFGFQNPGHARPDSDIYRDVLTMADQAEDLGFESIWATEHHFTDYQIAPDPLQFLTYMAGRTRQVQLGTMVVVLPWHDPVRVAERVVLLDILSGGRVILGVGRGLGKVEFDGFRVHMGESRERFVECAQLSLRALEDGYLEYHGKYFQQPRRELRPSPIKSFKGRTYAAAVSPDSLRIMAELGVGILIIPQKPWETVHNDLNEYRRIFTEVNGIEAPAPIVASFMFCDSDEERAREMAYTHLSGYYHSLLDHYQLAGDHFKGTKGYEYYDKMSGVINRYGTDEATKFFADLQVWGTPQQCYEKIRWLHTTLGCRTFVGIFDYAGLPFKEAERSMKLFVSEVMSRLQAM